MIKLKDLYEIQLSRPYYLTQKGKELIEDFTNAHHFYNTIISKYGDKQKNIALEEAMMDYDEYYISLWLTIGFDNKKFTTPQMFIKNLINEGFIEKEEEGLVRWNNFIKKGYIK